MKSSSSCFYMKNINKGQKSFWNLLSLSILSFSIICFFTYVPIGHASGPIKATFDPSSAHEDTIEISANAFRGEVYVHPEGGSRQVLPGSHPILTGTEHDIKGDQVWVAGDFGSWAHLQFWQGQPYDSQRSDPIIQAGFASTPSRYKMACGPINISGVMGWGLRRLRNGRCETITIQHSDWQSTSEIDRAVAQAKSESNSSEDSISITRSEDTTLVNVYKIDEEVAIDVLVGSIQVSVSDGSVIDVNSGYRYMYPAPRENSNLQEINLTEEVQSPEIQTFLDETTWSQEVASLIQKYKSELGLEAQNEQTTSRECRGEEILIEESCDGDSLEPEEIQLANLLNEYRQQNGLAAIPMSPSLSLVANRHVRDLSENIGSLTHDWSDCKISTLGTDSSQQIAALRYSVKPELRLKSPSANQGWECMWNAPQRLGTDYPGRGYENAYWSSGRSSADGAFRSWQNSPLHNNVIVNRGMWVDRRWQALGIGIYDQYAVMWVGEEIDPAS